MVMRKDDEQPPQHSSQQLAVEQPSGEKLFIEVETSGATSHQQNSIQMQSLADKSSVELPLMQNHSAYIMVSQSDDDSQRPATDNGFYH